MRGAKGLSLQSPPHNARFPAAHWRHWPALVLAAWAALALAVAVAAYLSPYSHSNYPCYEAGSRLYWAGRNMYDILECPLDFRYGPLFAVAITPFTWLPTWIGSTLWNWLNIGAFLWASRALARRVFPCPWDPLREATFLALLLLAAGRMLWSAQANSLILAAAAAAAIAILDRRWWLAAFLLAAPVHIKVWPLAPGLLLAACWPRQLGWRLPLALLLLAAIPLATMPPAVVCARYYDWYAAITGPMFHIRHEYRDAWTIWEFIQWPVDPLAYALVQLSSGLLTLAACLTQQRRQPDRPERLLTFVLGMWTCWQLVFGPGTERNTFGLIAPIAAWAVVVAISEKRAPLWAGTAYLVMNILGLGQVERALMDVLPIITAAHPLGVLLLAGWLLHYFWGWSLFRQFRRHQVATG